MDIMKLPEIPEFAVEKWMDDYETAAKYNIAETCAASVSLEDLQNLSDDKLTPVFPPSIKLTYGAIRGSDQLRSNLARLYSARAENLLPKENILITPGAIAANFLVLYSLIGKGDHVICHYPTYQQLYSVPASLGAEVSLWYAKEDKEWALDLEELRALIQPNTKMIIINNPNNPTGSMLTAPFLSVLSSLCMDHSLILFCDEVYRPLFHSPKLTPVSPLFPPSAISLPNPLTVCTSSLSKAFSLAGVRIGWLATRSSSLLERIASARHYTTISVSQIDSHIAAYALGPSCVHRLLARNIALCREALELLANFIEQNADICSWTRPVAGTTAFVKFQKEGRPVDDVAFCKLLMERSGVLFVPGSLCFSDDQGRDFQGYVRVGYAQEVRVVREGLDALRGFMRDGFREVAILE